MTRKERSDKGKARKPKTQTIRVPVSFIEKIKIYIKKLIHELENN